MTEANGGRTFFHDLGEFMAIPRLGSINLSPDGTWLAGTVQTLSADKTKYVTSIWRIDPHGGPARRLTRSAKGEGSPAFLPDGSLLFVSRRPDPDQAQDDRAEDKAALWLLPAGGGEARIVAALPGGVTAAVTARDSSMIVASAPVLVSAVTSDETSTVAGDERLRKERKAAGVSAILHDSAPIRYWDQDLGPGHTRLFAFEPADGRDDTLLTARDLTPDPGSGAFLEQTFALTPDGGTLITGWWHRDPAGPTHVELVAVDVATGKRRTLLSRPGHCYQFPRVSPDGRFVVCTDEVLPTADNPPDLTLMLVDLESDANDAAKDLLPDLDRWPADAAWSADSKTVYFVADDHGRRPVFKVDVATGTTTRLTSGDHSYGSLNPSPDGRYLYALRNAIDEPPTPVRIDLTDPAGQAPHTLESPGHPLELPGRLEEVSTTADDGQTIRSWLVLPREASAQAKAPLVLWVHGGPNSSWNSWAWRWNPWLLAAKGYAVLLPDPALSTGYGQRMLVRAHHKWGERTFKDVMAATDAALARDDLDATRTAMMGGSYGGYMANWIAGHTDRFKAIVSHASLWALDQMFSTTDEQMFWWGQFGDPLTSPAMYENNSPHLHVKNITTPMLVIHGDKDYRVPIGEALRLWGELTRHGVPARFLYFPDENHWVLTPGNATVWYQTVFAFLAQHVLGQEWERPSLL